MKLSKVKVYIKDWEDREIQLSDMQRINWIGCAVWFTIGATVGVVVSFLVY